jgi:hypothetical protein
MEELPLFLEGYMRIFDLCVYAFSQAQARYHSKVHEKLVAYTKEYLDGIKRSPRLVQGGNESRARTSAEIASPAPPADLGTGAGVERHWREGWQNYADAVEQFQIVKPGELKPLVFYKKLINIRSPSGDSCRINQWSIYIAHPDPSTTTILQFA